MIARRLLLASTIKPQPFLLPRRFPPAHRFTTTTSTPPNSDEEPKKKWSYKDYIPSRGWAIFWGFTGGLTTLALYDARTLESIQSAYKQTARTTIAEQPSGILERPRKVIVCLSPGEWGKSWFEEYVKPVFDAAALDYTLLLPDKPGYLRAKIRQYVWEGKTQTPVAPPPAPPAFSLFKPSTWFPVKETAEEFMLRTVEVILQKYHAEDGIIAIGPEAYREVLQGIQEGLLSSPTEPIPKRYVLQPVETDEKSIEAYDKECKAAEKEYENGWVYPSLEYNPEHVHALDFGDGIVVGYVPARNYLGWSGVVKRMGLWFFRRWRGEEVGIVAMQICQGKVRRFDSSRDCAVGDADGKDLSVREKGSKYESGGKGEFESFSEMEGCVSDVLRIYASGDN
ncbi:mitochondrial import inner membrane translocase subunit tim54 [Podochytrium sp. JEL0797]|nr:mitochondrial import inner membrane translocase subunit tim54 [Podochytrium sp. JEL0797]